MERRFVRFHLNTNSIPYTIIAHQVQDTMQSVLRSRPIPYWRTVAAVMEVAGKRYTGVYPVRPKEAFASADITEAEFEQEYTKALQGSESR